MKGFRKKLAFREHFQAKITVLHLPARTSGHDDHNYSVPFYLSCIKTASGNKVTMIRHNSSTGT
jgi:hypothetical protein